MFVLGLEPLLFNLTLNFLTFSFVVVALRSLFRRLRRRRKILINSNRTDHFQVPPPKRRRSDRPRGGSDELVLKLAVDRKVIRSHYFYYKNLIHEEKEELCKGDSNRFQKIIKEVDKLYHNGRGRFRHFTDGGDSEDFHDLGTVEASFGENNLDFDSRERLLTSAKKRPRGGGVDGFVNSVRKLQRREICSKRDRSFNMSDAQERFRNIRLQKKNMNLLAMAVGLKQKESVDKIVRKFIVDNFFVMLFHYDDNVDDWKDLKWSSRALHIVAAHQTKWWFAKRFLHLDIVSQYSYIFLWDEDLGVENFSVQRYLDVIKKKGLDKRTHLCTGESTMSFLVGESVMKIVRNLLAQGKLVFDCDYPPKLKLSTSILIIDVIQEYFETRKATAKGDVYSFDVVMLELLTGKKPMDKVFVEEGTKLVTWVNEVFYDLLSNANCWVF